MHMLSSKRGKVQIGKVKSTWYMGAHVDPAYLEFPHRWYRYVSMHIYATWTIRCLLKLLFVYPWTCMYICISKPMMHQINFILLHVSMIRVLLASSCMYGSPPSPNCLPLHVHEKLATMSQQIIYVLVMDELQNKPWRVLVQGSSSYMHTQCKSSTHYYSISRPVV